MKPLKINQKCPWRPRTSVTVDAPAGSEYREVVRSVDFAPCYTSKCPFYINYNCERVLHDPSNKRAPAN